MLKAYKAQCSDDISIYLGGIQIAEIRWHYRGGRNSMFCLFTVNGEYFFSRTSEAVLKKFEQAVGMKATLVEPIKYNNATAVAR